MITLLVLGSAGFYILGGREWTLVDALYMTIITLSTVGFSEVHYLDQAGKLWTIIVIVFGVTGFAVFISQITHELVAFKHYRKRIMINKVKSLRNHYILCGFGRTGVVIAKELDDKRKSFVVIENDPDRLVMLDELGYKYLDADATFDETLIDAGIEYADGIVVTLETDQDNLFVTMSARNLNRDAYLITRCEKHDTGKKLKRAGASKVVNPYIAGGHKMAELMLSPYVEDTVSLSTPQSQLDLMIDEIHMNVLPDYDGIMIKDSQLREVHNLMVVGIIDKNEEVQLNPDPHTVLTTDMTVMLIGSKEKMEAFKENLGKSK